MYCDPERGCGARFDRDSLASQHGSARSVSLLVSTYTRVGCIVLIGFLQTGDVDHLLANVWKRLCRFSGSSSPSMTHVASFLCVQYGLLRYANRTSIVCRSKADITHVFQNH